MSLCPHLKMDQCARTHCDLWNQTEEMCAIAIEMHERAALFTKLNNILDNLPKEEYLKASEDLKKYLSTLDKSKFN